MSLNTVVLEDRNVQHGTLSIITVTVLGMFVVIMIAGAQLISRIYHYAVWQEAEEHAFAAADAGVNYTAWLLNSGTVAPDDLTSIDDHVVTDPVENGPIGLFDLSFATSTVGSANRVTVTSQGRDYVRQDVCQEIIGVIQEARAGGGPGSYQLFSWDHQLDPACAVGAPPPPSPSPTANGLPLPT